MSTPLTWATLLAHWTGIAQRSLALPRTPEGDRLREAIPHLIGLEAISHALAHCDALASDERALGLDRAELGFRDHAGALHHLYDAADGVTPLPEPLLHAIADARHALAGARAAGLGWVIATDSLVVEHPAELVASLLAAGFAGDLMLPTPGIPLFRTCPCAFLRNHDGSAIDDQLAALVGLFLGQKQRLVRGPITLRPVQVYRQFDFARGGPARDLVTPWTAPDVPGQALLLAAITAGEARPVPLPPRQSGPMRPIPVVMADA